MSEINGCKGKGWTLVMKINGSKVKRKKAKNPFFVIDNIYTAHHVSKNCDFRYTNVGSSESRHTYYVHLYIVA